jgi:hypothetical protein
MTFKVDASTLNAMVSAMGALTICLTRQMTPAQRAGFADDLARLAKNAEQAGDSTLETLLIDLHRAAR